MSLKILVAIYSILKKTKRPLLVQLVRPSLKAFKIAGCLCALSIMIAANVIPFVKNVQFQPGSLAVAKVFISIDPKTLNNERELLINTLQNHAIEIDTNGIPIFLQIDSLDVPEISSRYRDRIIKQAYSIRIDSQGIQITGSSRAAVFYGIQTLDQLINAQPQIPFLEITDWPDLPVRMIMLDPARQNENFGYYRRVIRFAARYKFNAILLHLTDDQTACLYHEDYQPLMHPQAWHLSEVKELVSFAQKHHLALIPEIESFGHSRMFTRLPDYAEYLHQTGKTTARLGWSGTAIPGYTNVLCPASDKARTYLEKMYQRATAGFEHPWLHIGFDEVDITDCQRCKDAFGEISASEWIRTHLKQCRTRVLENNRQLALWGDMLLKYPQALDKLPPENTIIFDWHYRPDVSPESIITFTEKGFDIIACPALVCYPHMIRPDQHNYANIRRFTRLAREHDLLGVNTTIWIPTRYMSDVLWTGIAYAGVQAWSGSNWQTNSFYDQFMQNFFGSEKGTEFQTVWHSFNSIIWHRDNFNISCWSNDQSRIQAIELYQQHTEEVDHYIDTLKNIIASLAALETGITKHGREWLAIERSAQILKITLEHLQAAPAVKENQSWNKKLIRKIDQDCIRAIEWIENDWARNRYADDPNQQGLYLTNQHLLYRFKQMHRFHQQLLSTQ